MSSPHFAVSLMCMDFTSPLKQISVLNNHADSYHLDVADGHFAPNLVLSPDWLKAILPSSSLRNEAHLMVTDPDMWIEPLAEAGVTMLSPHAETLNSHAFRTLDRIHALGCEAGLCLNPMTPFSQVEVLLPRVSLITLMTVDVGYSGQSFIDETLGKIEQAARYRDHEGLDYEIQIDGACNAGTFKRLRDAGADTFVLGNTGLFGLADDVETAWAKMVSSYEEATGETITR